MGELVRELREDLDHGLELRRGERYGEESFGRREAEMRSKAVEEILKRLREYIPYLKKAMRRFCAEPRSAFTEAPWMTS